MGNSLQGGSVVFNASTVAGAGNPVLSNPGYGAAITFSSTAGIMYLNVGTVNGAAGANPVYAQGIQIGPTQRVDCYGPALANTKSQDALTYIITSNANTTANAGSCFQLLTGTANSWYNAELHDNTGSPWVNAGFGSAVSRIDWTFASVRARLLNNGHFTLWNSTIVANPASVDQCEAFTINAPAAISGVTFSGSDNRFLTFGVNTDNSAYMRALNISLLSTGAVSFYAFGVLTAKFTSSNTLTMTQNGASILLQPAGYGGVSLQCSGINTQTGYMGLFNGTTRQGYIGYMPIGAAAGAGHILYNNEISAGHQFLGSAVFPQQDNTMICGSPATRWSVVYAVSGTINTSDAREKKWRGALTDDELAAAAAITKEVGIYQWLEAIEKKGEGARLHVGVLAQRVGEIMQAHGLDPTRYSFFCYDEWGEQRTSQLDADDHVVAAGDRYGVRYGDLTLFMLAAQEQRIAKLEALMA